MEEEKLVMPGDLLGTSEEFTPGFGVYEERGNLYAYVTGKVSVKKDKSIYVIPTTKPLPLLHRGDVVIGRVIDLRNSIAVVELSRKKGLEDRELANTGLAALHVSNVRKEYVQQLEDEVGYFDIIRAKVLDEKSLQLSIVDPDLGVIQAYCKKCRVVLRKKGNRLVCPVCGATEKRKLSPDYGKGEI